MFGLTFLSATSKTTTHRVVPFRMGKAFFASVAGYVAGGNDSGGNVSGIDKVSFPADSKTTLSATLTTARSDAAGFANSGEIGRAHV